MRRRAPFKVLGRIAKLNETVHRAMLKHFPQSQIQADADQLFEVSGHASGERIGLLNPILETKGYLSRETMQKFFTWVITFFSGIRSIVLIVFGMVFLVCAGMALYDAATLWQARDWPSVVARVDQCSMNMRYSKQDSWWDVSATFSYGDDFARHHQETWTPPDTPRYSRHPDPVISASEQTALTKRFCDKAAAEGLRVSPDHPWMAWRSEAVAMGEWKTNVVMISVCGLGAVILIALGVSLWPGRAAAVKSVTRKKRPQAARKKA